MAFHKILLVSLTLIIIFLPSLGALPPTFPTTRTTVATNQRRTDVIARPTTVSKVSRISSSMEGMPLSRSAVDHPNVAPSATGVRMAPAPAAALRLYEHPDFEDKDSTRSEAVNGQRREYRDDDVIRHIEVTRRNATSGPSDLDDDVYDVDIAVLPLHMAPEKVVYPEQALLKSSEMEKLPAADAKDNSSSTDLSSTAPGHPLEDIEQTPAPNITSHLDVAQTTTPIDISKSSIESSGSLQDELPYSVTPSTPTSNPSDALAIAPSSSSSTLSDHDAEMAMDAFYSRYSTTPAVDLVFVLDRSGSVPKKGWTAVMQFITNVIEHFTVDANNTRVAVITYSTTASVELDDLTPGPRTDRETKCSLYDRLDSIVARRAPYGYTATHDALLRTRDVLLRSRPHAKKAVFVVTDGRSNIGPPPYKIAAEIAARTWNESWNVEQYGPQAEIFAFGVEEANLNELKSIASHLPGHVFHMTSFDMFKELAQRLHGAKQQRLLVKVDHDHCGIDCSGTKSQCMCATDIGRYFCVCLEGYEFVHRKCQPCKKGYVKMDLSADMCKACPANSTTHNLGSTSFDDCKLLPGFVVCPSLPVVEHSKLFYVSGTSGDEVPNTGIACERVTDGNSCHYSCDLGYRLSGSPVMTCNYSGVWLGNTPKCEIVDCHEIQQSYEHAVGLAISYVDMRTTYLSEVVVDCRRGTVPSNGNRWFCDEYGQWTIPPDFYCKELFCGPLTPLQSEGVVISPAECTDNKVPLDSQCVLTCEDGYALEAGQIQYSCTTGMQGKPAWMPQEWPICKDIEDPTIICPPDIDVVVHDWGHNSTVIHFESSKPDLHDNSGRVTFSILGAPDDRNFPVGYTILTYEARDAAGNTASCLRYINVRGLLRLSVLCIQCNSHCDYQEEKQRSVIVRSCPDDITVPVSSMRRMAVVHWAEPEFLGPSDQLLPYVCNVPSGREFPFGINNIVCYPENRPSITCRFRINVTDPICKVPFEGRLPANGALICGSMSHYYPKVCRIHCREGYELRMFEAGHKFHCRWDGTWTVDDQDGWPDCYKSRRVGRVLIENQLFVRFSGVCADNDVVISEGFTQTIQKILESEHGPCPQPHACHVENVRVQCGHVMRKRDVQGDRLEHDALEFDISQDNRFLEYSDGHSVSKTVQIFADQEDNINKPYAGNVDIMQKYPGSKSTKPLQVNISAAGLLPTQFAGDKHPPLMRNKRSERRSTHDHEGHHRRKGGGRGHGRSRSDAPVISVYLEMSAEISEYNESRVSRSDVKKLLYVLDDVHETLESAALTAGTLRVVVGNGTAVATVTSVVELGRTFDSISCAAGEIREEADELSPPTCYACPRDTFGLNNMCLECQAGYYQPLEGSITCIPVPSPESLRLSNIYNASDVVDCTRGDCGAAVEKTILPNTETFVEDCAASAFSCTVKIRRHEDFYDSENVYKTDFDLIFGHVQSHLMTKRIQWMFSETLTCLSLCAWIRTDSEYNTLWTFHANNERKMTTMSKPKMSLIVLLSNPSPLRNETIGCQMSDCFVNIRRNTWTHVCQTWTSLTGYARLYVNGSLVADTYSPNFANFINTHDSLTLGDMYQGEMSQFQLYSYSVTHSQVQDLAQLTKLNERRLALKTASNVFGSYLCHSNLPVGNLLSWGDMQMLVDDVRVLRRNRSICLYPIFSRSSKEVEVENVTGVQVCSVNLCQNNGTCISLQNSSPGVSWGSWGAGGSTNHNADSQLESESDQYRCRCISGFTGQRCEIIELVMEKQSQGYNTDNSYRTYFVATTFAISTVLTLTAFVIMAVCYWKYRSKLHRHSHGVMRPHQQIRRRIFRGESALDNSRRSYRVKCDDELTVLSENKERRHVNGTDNGDNGNLATNEVINILQRKTLLLDRDCNVNDLNTKMLCINNIKL